MFGQIRKKLIKRRRFEEKTKTRGILISENSPEFLSAVVLSARDEIVVEFGLIFVFQESAQNNSFSG